MYYPRSLTNVILACFVLSAVPLVVALAELAFGLDTLAKRSQLSVREAEAASAASRELRDVTGKIDTLVVTGGEGVRKAVNDKPLMDWLETAAQRHAEIGRAHV